MAVSKEYREFVLEQLERVRPVTWRSMFGGVGIYADGAFFAILADDRTFLKVDDTTRGDYEALGMLPFKPHGWPMKYFELPGELLEDYDRLRPWVEKAVRVAFHTRRKG